MLNATSHNGSLFEFGKSVTLVLLEEASQIPEGVVAATCDRMPRARIRLIGDRHQLPPYSRLPPGSIGAELGARSALVVAASNNAVPRTMLTTVFRCHPALNDLPNQLVYEGRLASGVKREDRETVLRQFKFPNPEIPFLLIDVSGSAVRAESKSLSNEAEVEVARLLLSTLRAGGVSVEQIIVIALYKEQLNQLALVSEFQGVKLMTADVVQGSESDVIILLTTKTDESGHTFFDDVKRLNVAITRAKQALFILGSKKTFASAPNWSRVVAFAEANNCTTSASELHNFLPRA